MNIGIGKSKGVHAGNGTIFVQRVSARSLEAAYWTAGFTSCPEVAFSFVLHGTPLYVYSTTDASFGR